MLKKIKIIHLLIIFSVIILISGILPPTKVWNFSPSLNLAPIIASNPLLDNFRHPPIPVIKTTDLPVLHAPAFIVVDNLSNAIIISKNPDQKIYPASTTKLATVLTALNAYPLDEVISVATPYTEGKVMELKNGEKITVRSLISALLIFSANDSAHALADHYTGGYGAFVAQMNNLMQTYQLKDTHFVNVDGIHDTNHYSTVYDLSQLGRLAIKNPIVRATVKTAKLTVTDLSGTLVHPLTTTNELLGVLPEIEGLKTGWTPEAGGSFIGLININGHELLSVVAASDDRFGDTKRLVDWLKNNLAYEDYSDEIIESATAGK